MILVTFSSVALGDPVYVDFCGSYDADYVDVRSVIQELDDDHFLDNDFRAARGAAITATMNQIPYVTFTIRLPETATTCSNGELCACVEDVPLDDDWTYNLKLKADVEIGPNAFVVQDNDDDEETWYHQGPTSWTPVSGEKHLTTGEHKAWRIAAAAGWALHRRDGIVCDDPFTFFTQTCPDEDPGVSCQRAGGKIYIANSGDDYKYLITHEQGHWMSVCANNGNNGAEYGANDTFDGVCNEDDEDLGMIRKVNAGEAAIEGIASYWAVVAFNQTSEADCELVAGDDYNQDGTPSVAEDDERAPSCAGGTANSWAGEDYVDNECGGTVEDRGTVYDYVRAFWDAEAVEGLTTAQVFQIYADADPQNWDGDGGGLSVSDDPQQRLESAASGLSLLTEWNNVDLANGIR